jgi:restriction system protein
MGKSMKTGTEPKKEEGARFVRYFGPLLNALRALGGSGTPDEVVERIAIDLKLSDEVQNETLLSGQSRFRNQVAWARSYLVWEGLLDSSKCGVWSLTERGRATSLTPEQARAVFKKWVQFFQEKRRKAAVVPQPEIDAAADPEIAGDIQNQLIELLLKLPPAGFERLSQRLLREAGFVQVSVTGRSGDGGIDGYGTLQVNPLVSFKVLFQCKKYKSSVTPSQVRDFRGDGRQGRQRYHHHDWHFHGGGTSRSFAGWSSTNRTHRWRKAGRYVQEVRVGPQACRNL